MNSLPQAITNMLHEIYESPTIAPDSRARIMEWLSAGSEWQFVRGLEQVLHIAEEAGVTSSQFLARLASALNPEPLPQVWERCFRAVPLPSGLSIQHLRQAMTRTQQMIARINRNLCDSTGFPLIHFIQANSFSGIVSNMLTDALDRTSPYRHNHDQRFPDLKNPSNGIGLEMKAANKPGKGGESHNGHGGWHLVACFEMDGVSGNVQFVHIEMAELVGYHEEPEGDWHYCGSAANEETGSRRTETYYTTARGTSKLRDGSVYLDTERVTNWMRWRHARNYPIPSHSPLYFQRIDNKTRVPSLHNPDRLVSWSTVKSQLTRLDAHWPLYDRQELAKLGISSQLVDIIRPQIP
ncbi:MAG: hypothetical protein SXV54_21160 [Chloroflexota bacterium]|nr:hypothetical protein [Chloroflexota bacterium]